MSHRVRKCLELLTNLQSKYIILYGMGVSLNNRKPKRRVTVMKSTDTPDLKSTCAQVMCRLGSFKNLRTSSRQTKMLLKPRRRINSFLGLINYPKASQMRFDTFFKWSHVYVEFRCLPTTLEAIQTSRLPPSIHVFHSRM
ncbi:hypothetical protein KQX54_004822 [Cotesia glomerata]|uniref:Uncharacterized protein n=1 Tax=Cotesia glomerata TaxID=32391 RepID=A0AAV7J4U6_COTGL|nr:hypothetical protein KQX54_004822 [Cotesia glomerata]